MTGIGCSFLFRYQKNIPPHEEINSIKYYEPTEKVYAYRPVTLDLISYFETPFTVTATVGTIYKKEQATFKIIINKWGDDILFQSLGPESDRFAGMIADLYEEKIKNRTMKSQVKADYMNHGYIFPYLKEYRYKAGIAGKNGKGDVSIHLEINLPDRTVEIGERWNGIAKKNFVNAFVAP